MNEIRFSQITERDFSYVASMLGFFERGTDPLTGELKMPAFAEHESMVNITGNLTDLTRGAKVWSSYKAVFLF